MNQPAQRADLRLTMPKTTEYVARMRAEWGAEHVNNCLRRASKGEPGFFYAIESGLMAGTAFPAGHAIAPWQANAVLWGVQFAVFMATPQGLSLEVAHGTH